MPVRILRKTSGVTLMEVTMAVAIFAVAIAMSAQALVTFYAAIDVQEQRVEALQSARSVLAAIRQKRVDFEGANDAYDWAGYFTWINAQQTAGWQDYLRKTAGAKYLNSHKLKVTLLNTSGNPATAGNDPLEIHVDSSWKDLRGRTVSVEVVGTVSEK